MSEPADAPTPTAGPSSSTPLAPAPGASAAVGASVDVDARDILTLIHQFLTEAGLPHTASTLLAEADIGANIADESAAAALLAHVAAGRWDAVVGEIAHMHLPPRVLMDVYEQIVRELAEAREIEAGRALLRGALPLQLLRREDASRFARLEHVLARPHFDARDAYMDGGTKEAARAGLARQLREYVVTVPPSRLVTLLAQALKWQAHTGTLPRGGRYDLVRAAAPRPRDLDDALPNAAGAVINFGSSRASSAAFMPDGSGLIVGSADGLIEVYEDGNGRIRNDLAYQARDEFMMHDDAVTATAVTRDSELLATGSRDGAIKVWNIAAGACVRRFPKAHGDGSATALAFSRDGGQLASGGDDSVVRVHGLRSGKALREFRGHTSYISTVAYAGDGAVLVSASADGSVRVWDARSTECTAVIRPPHASAGTEASICAALVIPRSSDHLFVLPRGNTAFIMTLQGAVLKTLTHGKSGADFIAGTVSNHGKYAYCLAEDGHVYSFSLSTGKLETCGLDALPVHPRGALGIVHHPLRNMLATFASDGTLRLWRP